MSELKGIIRTKGNLKGTVNTNVKTKAAVSVGGTLISSQTSKRGIPGTDGYSPSASVSKTGNKATITITDKDGTTTADIYDGSGGGASAVIAEYGVTPYADIKDAYDEDAIIICTVDDSGNTAICQLAYYDDANDTFIFAEPRSDGVYWASIASDDTWDDGYFLFASTDTVTQLRDGLMTALDKQKLDGIASGAEVNVQSDWNEADNTKDDFIKNKPTIPSKVSQLTNDSGFISSETDPVFTASAASGISSSDITSWNGKSTVSVSQKTSSGTNIADITINGTTTQLYAPQGGGGTITDVTQNGTSVVSGGVAAVTVPTKVSDLANDAGYITGYTETDPTVPSWAKASSKPSYTFSEIGSKPSTISGYGITDAKIASGTITLGSNTITPLTSFTETDPVFTAHVAHGITSTDISNWNEGKLSLDTSAASGTTDGDLYAAIVALGWENDVIE